MNCNLRVIEDEYNVILICPKYLDLKTLFILPKYYTQPSLERFGQLMNNKNADVISKLAAFVHHVYYRDSQHLNLYLPEAFIARINN